MRIKVSRPNGVATRITICCYYGMIQLGPLLFKCLTLR